MTHQKNEYWQPLPLSRLETYLNALTQAGVRFSHGQAVDSLLLDMNRGIERKQVEYARFWGWAESTVSKHIDELRARAVQQKYFQNDERVLEEHFGGDREAFREHLRRLGRESEMNEPESRVKPRKFNRPIWRRNADFSGGREVE